jgi:hypothetical protein
MDCDGLVFDSGERAFTCLRVARGINFGTHGFFDVMTRLCGWRWAEVSGGLRLLQPKTILKTIKRSDDDAHALDGIVRDSWGGDVALWSFGGRDCG